MTQGSDAMISGVERYAPSEVRSDNRINLSMLPSGLIRRRFR